MGVRLHEMAACRCDRSAVNHWSDIDSLHPNNSRHVGYAAWLANPVIAIAWILYVSDKQPAALISAVVSLGLTLSFLCVQDGPFGPKQLDPVPIISYGIGYWLWVASAAIVVAGMSADKLRCLPVAGHRHVGEADCAKDHAA